MAIEKVFAIEAEPAAIWDALWSELEAGDASKFAIESSNWPHQLVLRLELNSLPCVLTYQIEPREAHCEVSALLEPQGFRYQLFQALTFGHLRVNFELALAQGLLNLKQAVEPPEAAETPADD